MTMHLLKAIIILFTMFLLPGCAAAPFALGLIPGAPGYVSSIISNGSTVVETAVDERSTEQQMLDSIIAGHAQAELYKNKDIRANQITTYCYFNKLFLVGEYDSQDQLKTIYQCMDKVENKRAVVSHLYLRNDEQEQGYLERQAMSTELKAQLLADFEVTSSPIDVEVVQGDIILLGVIADQAERDRIMAHALDTDGVNRVISYLYHQENAGPEPRIMTAGLPPAPEPAPAPKPVRRKPRKKKRVVRKEPEQTTQAKAEIETAPKPPQVVNGRVLGL